MPSCMRENDKKTSGWDFASHVARNSNIRQCPFAACANLKHTLQILIKVMISHLNSLLLLLLEMPG